MGHCVEGPCFGATEILQIDGNHIKELYSLDYESVRFLDNSGKVAIEMSNFCHNDYFGRELSYFDIAEFNNNGDLALVPYNDIKNRFSEIWNEFISFPKKRIASSSPLQTEQQERINALGKIQQLIIDAYNGKSENEIFKKYHEIMRERGAVDLGLLCDPVEFIKTFCNKRW